MLTHHISATSFGLSQRQIDRGEGGASVTCICSAALLSWLFTGATCKIVQYTPHLSQKKKTLHMRMWKQRSSYHLFPQHP
jgi:hypothetical protein